MGKAKKLPSGNYRVREYDYTDENGIKHYKSFTAETKSKAEFKAKEFKAGKIKHKNPAEMTVGEAIDNYISLKEKTMSPSTIRGYKIHRRNYFQSLMSVKIDNLTDELIQRAIDFEVDSGKITDLSPATISTKFHRITTKLKIPNFCWHDIRHYTASVMLALNVPNQYAMKIMGHSTDNMLKTVYQHTMDDEMKNISNKINAFFDKV